MLEFFVPIKKIPTTTHQQKKVSVVKGKPVFYEPDELMKARVLLMAHLAPHAPKTPLTGPIHLTVKWLYPMTQKSVDGQYKTSKPDNDNQVKLLQDCMTELGFWKDDAHVASHLLQKFYSVRVGIYIQAYELNSNEGNT